MRSRWLGEQLRGKRLRAGMTAEEAARQLEWSLDKLSALELGEPVAHDLDVAEFTTLFEATTAETRRLIYFNRECDEETWLQLFGDHPTSRITTPMREESRATAITGYHPMLIPAPLRTSAYSRALCGLDQPAKRHENLARTDSVFYIDENALVRVVGGPQAMRDQAAHLLSSPAAIRLVPADAPVVCEGFTMLDTVQGRPVVHLEIAEANLFLENPEQVDLYRVIAAQLAEAARDVDASRQRLSKILN